MRPVRLAVLLPLALLPACAAPDAADRAAAADSAAPAAVAPAPDTTVVDTAWTLTETGFGPVRYGMTVDEARAALGGALEVPAGGPGAAEPGPDGCRVARSAATAAGVSFLVEGGRVMRVDVDSAGVRTARGVGVGDAEARVDSLHAGRVTRQPHKYVEGGRYLVVPAAEDTARQLVFETDGARVTAMRGGLLPQVGYVERCG